MNRVNIIYKEAWLTDKRYVIKYGGRGGGRSNDTARFFVEMCATEPYFKGVMVREVHGTIRDSQFREIKDVIEILGLQNEFKILEHSLSFEHVNGNTIIAKGLKKSSKNEEAKFKSVKDPTHVWMEEADEIQFDDFVKVDESVRTTRGKNQLILTHNTDIDPDHWLRKEFHDIDRDDTLKIHATYKDNTANLSESYIKLFDDLKERDYKRYLVSGEGQWGQKEINRPFAVQFDRFRHVTETKHQHNRPIVLSLDFNIDPFAFIYAHVWLDRTLHVHVFQEETIKGGTLQEAAARIRHSFKHKLATMTVTGDFSSSGRDITQRDHASRYDQLRRKLNLHQRQLELKPNPRHGNSRENTNFILMNADVVIDPSCKDLIFDLENVEVDENEKIIKSNRGDVKQKADHLDAFRYLCNLDICNKWLERQMRI